MDNLRSGAEAESEVKDPWNNPLFKDVEGFLVRIGTFVSMFGCAHIAIPKKKGLKFIKALRDNGYAMKEIEADPSSMFNRNNMKKLKFYEIYRAKKTNKLDK